MSGPKSARNHAKLFLTSLTILESIHQCTFPSASIFLRPLAKLPDLQKIDISGARIAQRQRDSDGIKFACSSLQYISAEPEPMESIIPYLQGSIPEVRIYEPFTRIDNRSWVNNLAYGVKRLVIEVYRLSDLIKLCICSLFTARSQL